MRDDPNERDTLPNHVDMRAPAKRNEDANLPAELVATHEALTHLATAWSATTPSAGRLTAFARQLTTQRDGAPPDASPPPRERPASRPTPGDTPSQHNGGRLVAGLAAAIVIVSLLAATLLKLTPDRSGATTLTTPTTPAPTATAAPIAEEAAHQPPSEAWVTVNQARLVPAPSNGNIVYETQGAGARVSTDGGATWRALTLPTLSLTHVASRQVSLTVGDTDPRLVLLFMQLSLDSANPADCPAGSTNSDQIALHGGILASGFVTCNAYYVSHDGGGSWTPSHTFYTASSQPIVWQVGGALYGLRNDVNRQPDATFPLAGVRLMASRDGGVSWSAADATLKQQAAYLCSVLPAPAEDALYAVTFDSPCFIGATGAHIIWRSVDGGATWNRLSSVRTNYAALVGVSPSASHRHWLYLLTGGGAAVAQRLLVSDDGGGAWTAIPAAPHTTDVGMAIQPVTGALADGSLVVAVTAQTGSASGLAPEKAIFYAWRPGDSSWRPLTTPLTAYYSSFVTGVTPIIIAHGGRNATDTLYVLDDGLLPAGQTAATHIYAIR